MAHSPDYRLRTLNFLEEGNTWTNTCKVFKISRGILSKWRREYAATGSLTVRPRSPVVKKLPPEKLRAYVTKNPDDYLREIAAQFHCTDVAVIYALRRLGITHKKKRPPTTKPRRSGAKNI